MPHRCIPKYIDMYVCLCVYIYTNMFILIFCCMTCHHNHSRLARWPAIIYIYTSMYPWPKGSAVRRFSRSHRKCKLKLLYAPSDCWCCAFVRLFKSFRCPMNKKEDMFLFCIRQSWARKRAYLKLCRVSLLSSETKESFWFFFAPHHTPIFCFCFL